MSVRQRQKQTVEASGDFEPSDSEGSLNDSSRSASREVEVSVEQEQVSHHAVGPIEDSAPEVPVVSGDEVTERIEEHREVFVLVGLAGAGKSTVADIIEEEFEERVVSFEVSDFVRTKFNEERDDAVDDNELGAWAAERKDEEGQDYFVREMAKTIKSPTTPHVVISGVRSPEEAVAVEDVFGSATSSPSQDGDSIVASSDATTTVGIWTLPDIRFTRKYGGKPSVEHDEWDTFTDRNERELWDWGAVEFFSRDSIHEADYIIPNHDDLDALREHVQKFLRGDGQYDTNPFPHSDFEKVAQYL